MKAKLIIVFSKIIPQTDDKMCI